MGSLGAPQLQSSVDDTAHLFRLLAETIPLMVWTAGPQGDVEFVNRRVLAIIDAEPECVKMLDAEGRLLEMNAAGLRMIEAEPGSGVFGSSVYPLIAEEHRDAFRSLTARVCGGERGTLEFEMIGLKGT